jgi:UDP-N-acetylglucosamine 1-carboxyvinyltransferase
MDLINVLQKMGAIISVDTDRVIRIEGVERLEGYRHTSLPDRIEAASWASAALATGGDIDVLGARQPEMTAFLNTFRKVGGGFEVHDEGIRFFHPGHDLSPIVLETDVHPGFMTDWQQPLVVALTQATGLSIVHETVYENRFGFTDALRGMGATIQVYRECLGGHPCRFGQRNFYHSAVISGPTPLSAADIEVPDLRGGFSHLIAALAAKGTSRVAGIGLIDRGYENFTDKLAALGADFDRD